MAALGACRCFQLTKYAVAVWTRVFSIANCRAVEFEKTAVATNQRASAFNCKSCHGVICSLARAAASFARLPAQKMAKSKVLVCIAKRASGRFWKHERARADEATVFGQTTAVNQTAAAAARIIAKTLACKRARIGVFQANNARALESDRRPTRPFSLQTATRTASRRSTAI